MSLRLPSRLVMFDLGMIVDVPLAVDQIETVERAIRSFAVKHA
jgi:hypothetical protein